MSNREAGGDAPTGLFGSIIAGIISLPIIWLAVIYFPTARDFLSRLLAADSVLFVWFWRILAVIVVLLLWNIAAHMGQANVRLGRIERALMDRDGENRDP